MGAAARSLTSSSTQENPWVVRIFPTSTTMTPVAGRPRDKDRQRLLADLLHDMPGGNHPQKRRFVEKNALPRKLPTGCRPGDRRQERTHSAIRSKAYRNLQIEFVTSRASGSSPPFSRGTSRQVAHATVVERGGLGEERG